MRTVIMKWSHPKTKSTLFFAFEEDDDDQCINHRYVLTNPITGEQSSFKDVLSQTTLPDQMPMADVFNLIKPLLK